MRESYLGDCKPRWRAAGRTRASAPPRKDCYLSVRARVGPAETPSALAIGSVGDLVAASPSASRRASRWSFFGRGWPIIESAELKSTLTGNEVMLTRLTARGGPAVSPGLRAMM